eukprot:3212103-Amphidinium_carterae.1
MSAFSEALTFKSPSYTLSARLAVNVRDLVRGQNPWLNAMCSAHKASCLPCGHVSILFLFTSAPHCLYLSSLLALRRKGQLGHSR